MHKFKIVFGLHKYLQFAKKMNAQQQKNREKIKTFSEKKKRCVKYNTKFPFRLHSFSNAC